MSQVDELRQCVTALRGLAQGQSAKDILDRLEKYQAVQVAAYDVALLKQQRDAAIEDNRHLAKRVQHYTDAEKLCPMTTSKEQVIGAIKRFDPFTKTPSDTAAFLNSIVPMVERIEIVSAETLSEEHARIAELEAVRENLLEAIGNMERELAEARGVEISDWAIQDIKNQRRGSAKEIDDAAEIPVAKTSEFPPSLLRDQSSVQDTTPAHRDEPSPAAAPKELQKSPARMQLWELAMLRILDPGLLSEKGWSELAGFMHELLIRQEHADGI